ncbi:MAG: hypothetical protein IKH74_03470 [Lachnospiraceae bacterium]|nr:hypothetical protein [Lachnospiraceae bacterium]
MYTVADARRECKELFEEGYGFNAVRIFLNDLSRGKDITWEENKQIMLEIMNGEFGEIECSFNTF